MKKWTNLHWDAASLILAFVCCLLVAYQAFHSASRSAAVDTDYRPSMSVAMFPD